jgi:hypothetical protein
MRFHSFSIGFGYPLGVGSAFLRAVGLEAGEFRGREGQMLYGGFRHEGAVIERWRTISLRSSRPISRYVAIRLYNSSSLDCPPR